MVLLTSALRAERPLELQLQALEGWTALMRALTRTPALHSQFISIMGQVGGGAIALKGVDAPRTYTDMLQLFRLSEVLV